MVLFSFIPLEFRLLLSNGPLLRAFIAQEILGRYAGSYAGFLWAIIHPLAQIGTFILLFHFIFRIQLEESNAGTSQFILYFLTGYFPWLLFSDALDRASLCLPRNRVLVSKVVFSSEVLPLSAVITAFVLNLVGFLLVLFYLAAHGKAHGLWAALLPLLVLQFLFTLGLAYFLATLVVFVPDCQEALRIVLNIWFYATPVLYPLSTLPKSLLSFVQINPMTHFVMAYRTIILTPPLSFRGWATLALLAVSSYLFGSRFFQRSKGAVADVL